MSALTYVYLSFRTRGRLIFDNIASLISRINFLSGVSEIYVTCAKSNAKIDINDIKDGTATIIMRFSG